MGKGGSASTFLIIFNVIYTVCGLGITATGIWFFIEVTNITSLRNENTHATSFDVNLLQVVPWALVATGLFILLASSCGFCGAKGNTGCLIVYILAQILAVASIVAIATVAVVVEKKSAQTYVSESIASGFKQLKENSETAKTFHAMENRFKCCGSINVEDYISKGLTVPNSCCSNDDCTRFGAGAQQRDGCSNVVPLYVNRTVTFFAGALGFLALVGVICVASAIVMSCILRKRHRMYSKCDARTVNVTSENI